jgi:UDP-GlcNAc:undecaprenyl-phosphate GlcNAc-1-phosphate transferase
MLLCLEILGAGFLLCLVLTPAARRAAALWGLMDHPDAQRKTHQRPIPLAGGVAVIVSLCAVLGAALLLSETVRDYFAPNASQFLGLLLAALAICALGVLDDCRYLRGRHKLLGQTLIVGIVVAFGVQIRVVHLFGTDVALGSFCLPVTFLWLLGAINSLNLLDGMDGLLSTVGIIATLAMAVMAVMGGHWAAACVAAALAGSLLGFLCYNFPPASVFLGDSGSMVIGLVVGVLGIESSLKGPATVALVAPVAILAIPFFDTLAAIVRRKLTGRSIYATDRGHLHHCLLSRGFSVHHVLLLVSLLCVLTAAGAFASLALRNEAVAVIAIVAVLSALIVARLFGHAELELFAKRLHHLWASFLEVPGAKGGRKLEVHLQGNGDWKGLLGAVTADHFALNLRSVLLDISAPALQEEYHAEWGRFGEEPNGRPLWRVELPLALQGHAVGCLRVTGYEDGEPLPRKIAVLNGLVQEFQEVFFQEQTACPACGEAAVLRQDTAAEITLPMPRLLDGRRVHS